MFNSRKVQKINSLCVLIATLDIYNFRFAQVRSGQVRSGRVGSVRFWSGQVRSGQVRSGQDRLGQVRSGQFRLIQARLGQVRLGQSRLMQGSSNLFFFATLSKCFQYSGPNFITFVKAQSDDVKYVTLKKSPYFLFLTVCYIRGGCLLSWVLTNNLIFVLLSVRDLNHFQAVTAIPILINLIAGIFLKINNLKEIFQSFYIYFLRQRDSAIN